MYIIIGGVVLVSSPTSAIVLEHEFVFFTCMFRGNPRPNITWQKDGSYDNIPVRLRREIITSLYTWINSTITIHTVSERIDAEVYGRISIIYRSQVRYDSFLGSCMRIGGIMDVLLPTH